ncbi:MAG TPA: FtsX-like permease family protein, partial [Chryseolinea sp.]|nr:FtsX-like permease family protein [Chryseolinea sp.]
YNEKLKESGKVKADVKFIFDVLLLFRPSIIRPLKGYKNLNNYGMYKSYFKIGWRNLLKNKSYSVINIGGLAIGMTVAMFIGLWCYDELSFNKYHKNYDDIAQVWSGGTDPETSETEGSVYVEYPLGSVLKNNYQHYFKHVLMARGVGETTISREATKILKKGMFIEAGAPEMLSLKMLKGSYKSLNNPQSIILSKSTAEAIFGNEDPMSKSLTIDNRMEVQVTGVYDDIPKNNRFGEVQFFSPWALWVSVNDWLKRNENDWDNRPVNIYVQLQANTSVETANAVIKDLHYKNVPADFLKVIDKYKPFPQVIPMSTWHLYSEFKNGKPAGGRITYVWLFGIVGIFVLLLACINFINLSTARSEKRAKEVGVRKAVGSAKWQLISQFLSESLMFVALAFVFSIVLVRLLVNWFNELADKNIALPFDNPVFWAMAIAFIAAIGFIAGLYPAFYLSSFQPVKVLKGTLGIGRSAGLPRRVLVVVQFTVSVILIVGTLVVYQQIQYARNRPVGYDRQSLITVTLDNTNFKGKQNVLRTELLNTGVVSETALSSSPLTAIWNTTNGYNWRGKDPNLDANFAICNVTLDFGKTINWELIAGRDFSSDLATDSTDAIVINEAAAKYMGFKNPVGEELVDVDEFGRPKWTKRIIGVVKDIVMESPYEPVRQTLYFFRTDAAYLMHIRISPTVSATTALPKIKSAVEKVAPAAVFDYEFVDDEYALKFSQEERIGKLSGTFSILAIFISCLGLFGLASFVAEQRTKEIGIRKVMGASVSSLWKMLSKDFVILVFISSFISIPIGYYLMSSWLGKFEYRTEISWWIFLASCMGALVITLLTVSYQAIKAALMNPVDSLRSE